jgi:hypothetical protein
MAVTICFNWLYFLLPTFASSRLVTDRRKVTLYKPLDHRSRLFHLTTILRELIFLPNNDHHSSENHSNAMSLFVYCCLVI